MVDVGPKPVTARLARAAAYIKMQAATLDRVRDRNLEKGDVLAVAQLAGIQGAKRTGELIPLCHPLGLDAVEMQFEFLDSTTLRIEAETRVQARTGVEMEALTAVAVAALTVYDMCKSIDRGISIGPIHLVEKQGGASGSFVRDVPSMPTS